MEEQNQEWVQQIIKEHNKFFYKGITLNIEFRLRQLDKLQKTIHRYESQIIEALYQDLGKSEFEAYATEIGFIYDSIKNMKRNLKQWAKPTIVKTPIHLQPAKSFIIKEPYGTILIIGPFNYPFQLLIEPLIGAIASGNCAVLKPSEITPNVSNVVQQIIQESFHKNYIRVVQGAKETTSLLIHAAFDYIFFTGSVQVGKIVMEAAAKNLVPITLELGGKSPVIVDKSANLDIAAKRIVWGKFMNAGQTCIAPDYVFVDEQVCEQFISKMKETIKEFYGQNPRNSKDFGRIINERQFDRLSFIIEQDRSYLIHGGTFLRENLFIEPTLIKADSWNIAAMQDEIFGPILPIMTYKKVDDVIRRINKRPKPLALYLFTENKSVEKRVLRQISFGGGCVNDTISHVANHHLPFGGVGNSGIGSYHGKYSFDLFSHQKSIVKKTTRLETGITFPPYNDKIKWVRKLLK